MTLSQFLAIMRAHFSRDISKVLRGDENDKNKITEKPNAKIIFETIMTWFMQDSLKRDFVPLNKASLDYVESILNGENSLPKNEASALLQRMNSKAFEEFYEEAELAPGGEQSLIDDFKARGEDISGDIAANITGILIEILKKLATKPRKTPIGQARFEDGCVIIRNQRINLPAALQMPEDVIDQEEIPYVHALLTVYAQDAKIGKEISVDDLDAMDPIYKVNLRIQRSSYYSAESVLHQIRDCDLFTDADKRFHVLKVEILDAIEDVINRRYRNGFDRLQVTMDFVAGVTITKAGENLTNGLIGAKEKRGIIHILVNDGKVTWLRDYDNDIQH